MIDSNFFYISKNISFFNLRMKKKKIRTNFYNFWTLNFIPFYYLPFQISFLYLMANITHSNTKYKIYENL